MSIAAPRRVGIAGLLGLLAGAIILLPVPGNPGALRLAGVGLLWWYAALAAPLAAILLVIVVRRASAEVESGQAGAAAIAVWTSPVVLALVAARVFTGAPEAPTITLAVLVAPLVALLGPAANGKRRPNVVAALAVAPWDAWRDIASRPALTFDARNPWVTDGRTLAALTTLEFTEAHRVTALNLATYRVFEPGRFREWQLRAGESLSLRAGDH